MDTLLGLLDGETAHNHGHFILAAEVELHGHDVARVVDLDVMVGVALLLTDKRGFKAAHLVRLAVDQHHVRRLERADEARGLLVVRVRGEADVLHLQVEGQLLAVHGGDLLGVREDELGQGPRHAVARHDAAVLLVRAPRLEQLPRQAGLHHAGARQ